MVQPSPHQIEHLSARAREAVQGLAAMDSPEAFTALLGLSEAVGLALAESARTLASGSSWSQVGAIAGTSKQAAWSRWRG